VTVADVAQLRASARTPMAFQTARHARVTVTAWVAPWPGWSGRLGPLPGLVSHRVRLPTQGRRGVVVDVTLTRPQPMYAVLGAVLDMLVPAVPVVASASPDVAAFDELPEWMAPSSNVAAWVGPNPTDEIIRPYDRLASPAGEMFDGVARTPDRLIDPRFERPDAVYDSIDEELRRVRERRAALRETAAALVLAGPPLVSVLVPAGAVAPQTYPAVEVVSGPGSADELTRRSRGSLLTVFDDSCFYGPEHIWDLVLARYSSGATVVGKAAEFVYHPNLGVTVRRRGLSSDSYATTVHPGALLLSRGDLDSLGGWDPELLERVKRGGGLPASSSSARVRSGSTPTGSACRRTPSLVCTDPLLEQPSPEGENITQPGTRCRDARGCAEPRHRRSAGEADVCRPTRELEALIELDRPGVGVVNVEHDLVEPLIAQVPQAGQSQRSAQAEPGGVRVDTEDVHLADRVVRVLLDVGV
jgi:hypothetical protein